MFCLSFANFLLNEYSHNYSYQVSFGQTEQTYCTGSSLKRHTRPPNYLKILPSAASSYTNRTQKWTTSPPPKDVWQHRCHCRSLSSGPLCLHIALWKFTNSSENCTHLHWIKAVGLQMCSSCDTWTCPAAHNHVMQRREFESSSQRWWTGHVLM